MAFLTCVTCSPTPAVNTTQSTPPSAAAYAPRYFLQDYENTSSASAAL